MSSWVTFSASSWCNPVRGTVETLDAVQIGDVVVLGLGEVGIEVVIGFSPDDDTVDVWLREFRAGAG